jgi:hypothetical protein
MPAAGCPVSGPVSGPVAASEKKEGGVSGDGGVTETVGGSPGGGGQECIAELLAIAEATGLLDLAAHAVGRAIGTSSDTVKSVAAAAVSAASAQESSASSRATVQLEGAVSGLSAAVAAVGRQHDRLRSDVTTVQQQLADLKKAAAETAATMTRLDKPDAARDQLLRALPMLRADYAVCICARDHIPICCRPCSICF